jgi:hypothetical protein
VAIVGLAVTLVLSAARNTIALARLEPRPQPAVAGERAGGTGG